MSIFILTARSLAEFAGGVTAGFMFWAVIALPLLVFPAGRRVYRQGLLAARYLYAVLPLRLVTGRRQPDYLRIWALERENGIESGPEALGRALQRYGISS